VIFDEIKDDLLEKAQEGKLRETIPGLNSTWGNFIPVEVAEKVSTYIKEG